MNYNTSQLLEAGKGLFQQGLIDEQKPQFYSHAGSQFMKGNPFVPYNNPIDTALNEARLFTYDDSFSHELADRYREYARKTNFILAYLFLSKSLYLNPSDSEAQEYINLILSKLNLSPINILRNGYAMFEDYGLPEWMQICNSLLNNAVKSSSLGQNEAILIEMDKRLRINPNDPQALLGKGFILFQMAKKDSTLDAKRSKLIDSLGYISRAFTLKPSYLTEYNVQEIIRNLSDTTTLDVVTTNLNAFVSSWASTLLLLAKNRLMVTTTDWRSIESRLEQILISRRLEYNLPVKLDGVTPESQQILLEYLDEHKWELECQQAITNDDSSCHAFFQYATKQIREKLQIYDELEDLQERSGGVNAVILIALGTLIWLIS